MNNDWTWLDELPDYGAAEVLEKEQQVEQVAAQREPLPLPIPGAAARSREEQQGDLRAFLIAGKYDDAEVTERLKLDPMLEGLNARRKRMDGLNSRAVAGQMVMQYAFPELKQEPGAYFMKVGKELPELQTRTEAYAAVYDDYMAGVEKEYQGVLQRRAAWQQHKNEVSQAVVDVVNGRVSPAQLASRLTPEQQEVYAKEFDGAAIEKAGVAMGMVRGAFAESVEDGLKQMVNQGLANGVVAALSDADAETGELVLNEAAVKFFEGALFSLAKEAKDASGEDYKFLHNMLLSLGNPVRRRSVDIQSVLSMGVKADTAAALALAGEDAASKQVQGELQVDIDELKRRWSQEPVYARLRGMLDAAQAAGNETAETADFLVGTVNALGSVIGQTAPFFVPVVGTPVAFLQAYDEKRNAAYYKGLPEGTAEWSAFIDAATSVTVEKIAYGSVGRISGTGWLLSKIPGYSSARATLLGSFYARAALEVGAGAVEESALEPTAEALLQWGLRNGVFSWVGVDVGGKYSWREYREELKAMFKPEQLAATVLFGAGLTGVQSPMIKQAAEGYSKHVEHLMAQGISREEARNISIIADADERVAAAVQARAEAWKDPAAAQANQLVAATMFREIDEARAFWEAEAYKRAQSELNLPKVENVAGKSDRFLITTFDRESGAQLFSGEVGTEQLLAMLGHYVREEERMRIHHAQSAMGANALLRAAEQSGEVVVEDMAEARNPETGERVISEAGAMGVEEFKYAAELALDELEVRKASGMSEQEALATPFSALSRYMPLGNWLHLAKAFEQRLQTARETTGEQEADATRVLNATPAAGTTKADTLLLAARGQVEAREVLEDGIEHAQKKVTGNDPAKMKAWHALLRDAQKAVKQLGFKLDFYQGRDDMSAAELQAKMTEGMSKLASSYVLLNAEALPLPGWVKDLVKWHMAQLEDAQAIVQLAEAYKQGRERGNITQELEDVLAEIGQATAGIFRTAQLEAADVQAYKDARARYRTLTGDVSPTVSEIQQEQQVAEEKDAERVRSDEDVKSVQAPRADGSMDEQTFSPAADLPEEVRGAFPTGACYNVGARAWLGMVPVNKLHLSPDAPQVKKGSNKKGVVNPLVGDYRQDAPAVYVWQRKNGTLEVISGRHRLDLAKRTNTEMIAAYVYPEDAEHDAKWARLLDYEQNMQDDQADELTAATYVRETGLSDAELTRRGLTRGGSKSARGILIGREAREDLWSRFASRSINPMLAEAICKLTMHIPDKSRIDAMQAMAASDLAAGKSLDRVAAKLQLMAHAEADGEGVQGMLSFGASFDEALERSAEFIEQSLAVINKHIAAVTKARSLGQTGVSEAEGITVGLDMDPKQRLAELNELKAAYEKCGFHEHIRFRALTWDGKSAVDPIGDYAKDKAAAAELSGPTAEELEQQARDAAAEATGTFGFSVTKRNLAAVHSLSPEKFLSALELGGMPMPSVAVTRLDKPYGWGGGNNLYLIGRPELVDPAKGTEVFSADAWTGKFPRVVHKHVENADFKEAAKIAGKMADKYGYLFYQLDDKLRQAETRSDLEYLLSDDNGKALFAVMQGYEPKAKTVAAKMDYEFLDKQFAKDVRAMWEHGDAIKDGQEMAFADAVEASLERWLDSKEEKMQKLYRKLYGELLSDLRNGRPYGVWFRLKQSLNNMGKRELDAFGNREMLVKYADKHKRAHAAWVKEKVDQWRSKEGYIRENGQEATLDNVVRFMLRKKGLNNEEFMGFSPGKLRAALSAKMKSLDDIKANRGKLGDSQESKQSKEPSEQLMKEYCRYVHEYLQEAGVDSFYSIDYGLESLSLVKGKPTVEKLARAVRKVFSYTKAGAEMAQDAEMMQKGVEAVESVRREVEDYMEAVPQRAVKMNEWEYAVMPESLKKNKPVMAGLRENGIKPIFYDSTEEGRKAALAGLVDNPTVSFSVIGPRAKTWDKYDDARKFTGRDDGLQRVEIDASKAKLKWEDLRGRNVSAYRRIVEGWDKLPENDRKAVEDYAEQVYDWQDASKELNDTPEKEFLEQYNKVVKMRDAVKAKRAEIRSLLNKMFVEQGGSAAAVLNMKDGEVDELAMSLWGPYVESNVEDVLDLHPLWHGGMRLDDVMDYPELYAAYPELASVTVRYVTMDNANGRAMYGDGEHEILINRKLEGEWQSIHSILLHEIQHHIQNIEGFAKGGNPSYARRLVNNRAGMGDMEAQALRKHSDMELYNRIAGEIEARNVQARYGWSMDRRAAIPFNSTLEYPGEALVSFSVSDTLMEDIARARKRAKNEDGTISQDGEMSRNAEVELCTMPDFMRFLGEPDVPVVARVFTLRKLLSNHKLTDALTYEVVQKMNDPVLAIQETPSTYIVLLDVEAENKDGVMAPVVCAVEHKKGKDGNRYLVSAYSLDNNKEKKITEQFKKLVYCKHNATAKFTADAPQSKAYELLRAAISGGHTGNVATLEDVVKWKQQRNKAAGGFSAPVEYPGEALVTFSVTSMANAAQGLLEGGAMEVTRAAELVKDFNAQIANWNRVAAGKTGRADARTGAEMFGAVQALLSSARRVLPDGYRANVYTQMQWAAIYAGMAETGQLPAEGALKGNAKIMEAFRKKMLEETAMAANAQEVEDMLADIGERKLNEVMVKVLQKVRGQLVKYAKQELWEKMGRVIAYAKSKEEQGKKSKRGKMSAVDYAKLARYEEMLAMDPDKVREELDGLQGKLSKANADRTAELEAEMQELSLYGGWKGMSLQQAHAAYQAMVLFCATGRNSWKRLLDRRKAEIEWLAKEMSKALPTDRTMSGTRHAENTKLRKALAKLPYGTMSYSQLMLALSSRLGEGFCFERIQEMTEADVALLIAEYDRMKWLYGLVQQVSGLKGEIACEKWLAAFDEQVDTGIKLSPMAWCEVTMTLEEADAWLALGKEEREKLWAERDAEEKRLKRSLREERPMVPEALLPELRKQLKEYRANERKRSGKVTVRGEYMDKGRARTLVCSRDAALYAILLHEQTDYQTVFGRPGEVQEAGLLYREGLDTPEKIQKLYDFVGPAGLRYGYALREKLHEQGLSVAQVWEEREGTPFRFRDNYFRASFDRLAIQDKNPLTDSNVSGVGGGKYGMLINRVAHHQEAAKWDQGASMVFLAASMEQDNYIYTSHITDRWRKLLLQREFANKLKAYLGEDVMKKLVAWLDVIDGAPLDNLRAFMNLGHWQGFFTGAWAMSVLSGNGYVLMKQSSALLHGYAAGYVAASIKEQEDGVREVAYRHIGFLEFLGHALGGGPISDKELAESRYFRARRIEKGRGVAMVGMQDAGRKRSSLGWLSERTGELIERLDAWINRKSARALANAAYAASKKLNAQHGNLLTEEQLKEGALQAVGRMLELGAQPLTRTQKSMFQNGSGLLGKLTFAMKSESINKLGLMSAQVVRGERVAPINAWLAFGVFNAAIAFLIAKLQGNDDEDGLADDVISGVVSTLTGPLSAVPVLSEGVAELASLITGERVYSSNLGKQILDVGGIARGIKKLYRHHEGEREMSWEQYFQAVTTLLRASGAGFGAFARSGSEALSSWGSLALSAAAGANLSRVAKDVLCTVGLLERKEEKKKKKSKKK